MRTAACTVDAEPDPVSVEIVEKQFEDQERRRYADIARTLKLSDWIGSRGPWKRSRGSSPSPAAASSPSEQRYIADYVMVLNEEGIPGLRASTPSTASLLRRADEARQYV
jgi:hypothetical protein